MTQRGQGLEKTIKAQFDKALSFQNAKKLDEAAVAYCEVLRANPDHADAQHNLGLIRLTEGLPQQALVHLQYAINIKPNLADAHNTLGNVWRALGRPTDAAAAFRRAVELRPNYALAWYNLGNLRSNNKDVAGAEAAYRTAIAAKPDYVEAYLNLGNVLREQNRQAEARALLEKLVGLAPKYSLAWNNLGNIYRDLDRLEDAEASYRKATEADPDYALAWLNLGTVLNHLGRRADSVAALKRVLEIAPRFGEPYMQLASTIKLPLDSSVVENMQYYYSEPSVAPKDKMHMAFALGRVNDEHGRYDKAFEYFKEGNRLKRGSLAFDISAESALVERTCAVFNRAYMKNAPRSPIADPTPIFIVGMMRSGTTLLEQILASHPDVVGADELPWIPELALGFRSPAQHYPAWLTTASQEDMKRLGQTYIERLRDRFGPGPRLITDKLPGNFLFIGLISLILPGAKIIHMKRNPYDTCLSIFTTLFASLHHYAYDLRELAQFYLLYEKMMNHWDVVMPGKVFYQEYETLITRPENSVRAVLDHCGLTFEKKCLDFHTNERRVRTASSQQVREKLNSRSIARWRNYEKHLSDWKAMFGDRP